MPPKKGQKFTRYPEETKNEAVRLRVEEGLSLSEVKDQLGIKSDAQIVEWVRKYKVGRLSRIIAVSGRRILVV
jgi:transposase